MKYTEAWENFSNSEEMIQIIKEASKEAIENPCYKGHILELFVDGNYRIMRRGDLGNLYDSPGVLIPIFTVSEDELDTEDYENSIDAMRECLESANLI